MPRVDEMPQDAKIMLDLFREMRRPLSIFEVTAAGLKRCEDFFGGLMYLVHAGLVRQDGIIFEAVENDQEESDD